MADPRTERKELLRAAIVAHLQRQVRAGDTARGIVAHWLPARGFEDALGLVHEVLEQLVADGVVLARALPEGTLFYTRGPNCPP